MNNCNRCKHYYVTWDEKFPYGCRAMNFKSRESPFAVVFKSSGIHCLMFELKERLQQKDKGNSERKKA